SGTTETELCHVAATDDAERILEAYETFLGIEASGWKGERGERTAIRLVPEAHAFFGELIRQRSADFAPEIMLLARGDRAIAGQYTVRLAGCRYVLKIGYDERERLLSPGQTLMAIVAQEACAGGLASLNLVTGVAWHGAWRPRRLPAYEVLMFRDA